MLELAIGIILGGCALGAGCAMIAGIGPGIGEERRCYHNNAYGMRRC